MNKFILPILAIAALMGLSGCPSVPSKPPAPFITKEPNLIVHTYSGVQFPAQVGLLTRDGVSVYDPSGMDVSAAYNCRTPVQITATAYSFPSPRLTSLGSPPDVIKSAREHLSQDYFNEVKSEIRRVHPSAVETRSKDIAGPESTIGKYAEYKLTEPFFGKTQALTSQLYIFTYFKGTWTIKYRFTYPSNPDSDQAVDDFIKKHTWTGQVEPGHE